MDASCLLQRLRGRPTARFRGGLLYAQPAAFLVLAWSLLFVARLVCGRLPALVSLAGVTLPLALVPLCMATTPSHARPAPTLRLTLARLTLLTAAMVTLHAVWQWMGPVDG